jgi:eukaryotic-like serine/threonine-protein kinase
MPLSAGARLGTYEIASALGAGGMGEVYRARDTKLGRDVAIKILPDEFSQDPDRIARFQREAHLLAALNHPNIAAIYGLDESDSTRFLVLELVDGQSLAEKLAGDKGLPTPEALGIARQIIDALEAAHDKGIVHRDLKPSNIMVTEDGRVKILDFGLAKHAPGGSSTAGALSQSPTITAAATMAGMILGTAAYMSPEQAKGREADKRSDVWAFGCVLYEMLTGRRAFDGEDVSETLAAVLRAEPDWSVLPADVPLHIQTLVKRCLAKDRKTRIGDVSTVRYVMDEIASSPAASSAPIPAASPRSFLIAAAALVSGAAVSAAVIWLAMTPAPPPTLKPVRFSLATSDDSRLATSAPFRDIAISPAGTHIVYVTGNATNGLMWVRALDELEDVQLRGLPVSQIYGPFISPDGKWIGFGAGNSLLKVSMTGGPPITIAPNTAGTLRGASWGPDDVIVFGTTDQTTGLMSVPAGGGESKVLTKPDPKQREVNHWFPSVLPGGRAVLFTITTLSGPESSQIAALDLQSGDRKILIRGGSQAEYVDPLTGSERGPSTGSMRAGYLVYAVAGTLRAVRFDPVRLEVLSDPVPIVDEVLTKATGAADFTVSKNGALVYVQGPTTAGVQRSLVWVTREGREEPIKVPPRAYVFARLSPDGTKVALDIRDQQNDIWILDLAHETLTPLTIDPAADQFPVWTPNGKTIIFSSTRTGGTNLYWQAADGTGTAERLTTSNTVQTGLSIAPDGTRLVIRDLAAGRPSDLSVARLENPLAASTDGRLKIDSMLHGAYAEDNGVISSDGRWLAYESNESTRSEVYVRPFPDVDAGRWPISSAGGSSPLWAPNGRELFYIDAAGFLSVVAVQTSPTFTRGNPRKLLNTRYFVAGGRTYDVSRDGHKFLMIKDAPAAGGVSAARPAMTVVLNWFEELKTRVQAK